MNCALEGAQLCISSVQFVSTFQHSRSAIVKMRKKLRVAQRTVALEASAHDNTQVISEVPDVPALSWGIQCVSYSSFNSHRALQHFVSHSQSLPCFLIFKIFKLMLRLCTIKPSSELAARERNREG